jgi:hypothetical protein
MKFRPIRGGLEESMREVREWNTRIEIEYLAYEFAKGFFLSEKENYPKVEVKKYGTGIDERIGWDTHLVLLGGSPVGFTDGPIPNEK